MRHHRNKVPGLTQDILQAISDNDESRVQSLLCDKVDTDLLERALESSRCQPTRRMLELILNLEATTDFRFELDRALHYACDCQPISTVELLLDHGADVNARVGSSESLLQNACYMTAPDANLVRLLLDRGAEVNPDNPQSTSPLQAACSNKMIVLEMQKLLLQDGFNRAGDPPPVPIRFLARPERKDEAIKILLQHGASVNHRGGLLGTALQIAAYCSWPEVVDLLLDHGAEVNVQAGGFGTALQAAVYVQNQETVAKLLIQGAEVNLCGGLYGSALQAAALTGNMEIAKLLLTNGAEIDLQGGCHCTALQAAAHRGHEAMVTWLLENGAKINIQGGRHGNALQAAIHLGDEGLVRLLLNNGADPSIQPVLSTRATVLHIVVSSPFEIANDILGMLLDRGADGHLESQDEYGRTPLYLAVERENSVAALLLLERGASPEVAHLNGKTVLQLAVEKRMISVVNSLFPLTKKSLSSIRASVWRQNPALYFPERCAVELVENLQVVFHESAKDLGEALVERSYPRQVVGSYLVSLDTEIRMGFIMADLTAVKRVL